MIRDVLRRLVWELVFDTAFTSGKKLRGEALVKPNQSRQALSFLTPGALGLCVVFLRYNKWWQACVSVLLFHIW